MGPKSRGNFPVTWCSRVECLNRDKECTYCFQYSDYKPPPTKKVKKKDKSGK